MHVALLHYSLCGKKFCYITLLCQNWAVKAYHVHYQYIKIALCVRPSVPFQTWFSRQPLGWFQRDLACGWISHAKVRILKIRTTGHLLYHVRAVRMSLFFSLSPISQQPLGWFGPNLAGRWVLSVPLWILEIRMICHTVRISYNKKKGFSAIFPTFSSPISHQPLDWCRPNLAGRWVLIVAL